MIVFAIQFGIFAVVFGLAWLASRASCDDLLCRWPGKLWIVPASLGYSVLLRLGLGVIALLAGTLLIATGIIRPDDVQHFATVNRPDVAAVVDISALRNNPLYFWLTLTLVSFVLAGFREELWRSAMLAGFRVLWPNRFASFSGQIAAATITAVVFGAGHLAQGPIAAFGAGLLGLGLGIIMVAHRSIWPAVIAHGAFDATTFGLLPWALEKLQGLQ